MNGGTCQFQNGTAMCKCSITHTGNVCQTLIKEFCGHPNPCKNNGHCDPGKEACACSSNFTGMLSHIFVINNGFLCNF